jgi:hypothetical protein
VPSGGRERILEATYAWVARYGLGKTTVDDADSFPELLEQALLFAHDAIEHHEVLQKILETEPERLLPMLTVESWRLRRLVVEFLLPHVPVDSLRPGTTRERAADYVARMLSSFEAGRRFAGHGDMQFLLAHEPERVLPHLAFGEMGDLLRAAGELARPWLGRHLDDETAVRVGEWAARIMVPYTSSPDPAVDLGDEDAIRPLVRTFVLPGIMNARTHREH